MELIRRLSVAERLAALSGLAGGVAALAGFVPGLYRDTPYTVAGSHGQDAANLLGVGILWLALVGSSHGSIRSRLVAVGAVGYLLYSYTAYAYLMIVNPVTVLYYAVLGCAIWSLVAGLLPVGDDSILSAIGAHLPRRTTGAVFIGTAVLFAFLWLGQIAASIQSGKPATDLVKAGWPTSPYYANDLAVVLPLMFVAGLWVSRRAGSGIRLAIPLLVFATLMDLSIFATLVSGALANQATFEPAIGAVFVVHGAVCAALSVVALAPSRLPRLAPVG